ncbi:MAG TPA: sigma 54-interacting transcriptional regulator [Candidatus Kapabacteria bacterium]|nr:sigma 54-interacting transcriptional regulator [Candidatus Kapabacteria bacterium]
MQNETTMWGKVRAPGFSVQASRYALTIAYHEDWQRIGATAYLDDLSKGKSVAVSRLEPEFQLPFLSGGYLLDDRYVSRKPLTIEQLNGRLLLTPHPEGSEVRVDGQVIRAHHYVFEEVLQQGVVIELGQRVVLVLHSLAPELRSKNMHRMLGVSEAIESVRRSINRVADLDVPVLIRGETGTGKELVASAIHNASLRSQKPLLAVNVAAIPDSLAISELFGARKGSFTGAARDKPGYFVQADNSTLFLDEIGDAPDEVQVALLRTLETGEVRPVGATDSVKVDVRMIAATDANLESKLEAQTFRNPLLQRLAGFEIWLSPLAQRKADIGLLLAEFLRFEFDAIGEQRHYQLGAEATAGTDNLWYRFFRQALEFPWPGNIRQMRNVARQVAIHNRQAMVTSIPFRIEAMLAETRPAPETAGGALHSVSDGASNGVANTAPGPAPVSDDAHDDDDEPGIPRRKPSTVTEAELMSMLEQQRWDLKNTAEHLNISRAALYKMIEANPRVRKAGDISVEEIQQSYVRCGGNLERMVEELKVSGAALKRRIRELGIG